MLGYSIYADDSGVCLLTDESSSPLVAYEAALQTLATRLEARTSDAVCTGIYDAPATQDFVRYARSTLPIGSATQLLREIQAVGTTGADLYDQIGYTLDIRGPTDQLQIHENRLIQIRAIILRLGQSISARCAGSYVITDDLTEGDTYDTRGRMASDIILDMSRQTAQVSRLFYLLGQRAKTDQYDDTLPFSLAPPGFASDMSIYFNADNIAQCRENEPRKKAIEGLSWRSFLAGFKISGALQVWKEATDLLMYRGAQIAGSDRVDASKDATIAALVESQRGLSSSGVALDSAFFREFGTSGRDRPFAEKAQEIGKKFLSNTSTYGFVRNVATRVAAEKSAQGQTTARSADFTQSTRDIESYVAIEKNLYNRYTLRRAAIESDKSDDPELTSDLITILSDLPALQKNSESALKNICKSLKKQAGNVSGAFRC